MHRATRRALVVRSIANRALTPGFQAILGVVPKPFTKKCSPCALDDPKTQCICHSRSRRGSNEKERIDGKPLFAKFLNEAFEGIASISFGFRQPSCRVYNDIVGIVNAYDMFT